MPVQISNPSLSKLTCHHCPVFVGSLDRFFRSSFHKVFRTSQRIDKKNSLLRTKSVRPQRSPMKYQENQRVLG